MLSVTPFVIEMVNYYGHYRNGFLPREGGLDNQDNIIISCINILSQVDADIQKDKIDKNR